MCESSTEQLSVVSIFVELRPSGEACWAVVHSATYISRIGGNISPSRSVHLLCHVLMGFLLRLVCSLPKMSYSIVSRVGQKRAPALSTRTDPNATDPSLCCLQSEKQARHPTGQTGPVACFVASLPPARAATATQTPRPPTTKVSDNACDCLCALHSTSTRPQNVRHASPRNSQLLSGMSKARARFELHRSFLRVQAVNCVGVLACTGCSLMQECGWNAQAD